MIFNDMISYLFLGGMFMKRSEQRRQKKKRYKIPLLILLAIVLFVGGWGVYTWNNAKQTVNKKMYQEVDTIDHQLSKKKIKEREQLNILILGIDSKTGSTGRSDSLMVMTLKPETNSMQLISIPRDTRTLIVGKGFEDKINHAYAFGGEEMAIATVENFLNIDIDYHVSLNMMGLQQLIDELGGITVTNDLEWSDKSYTFNKGPVDLDGQKALAYVRMRKQDPAGDFGRAKRQRQVVEAIVKKGASVGSVGKINPTIGILGDNMSTSLDFDDMKRLLTGYTGTRNNVESYQVQGEGTMIDGTYFYIVSDEERQNVHQMIVGED